MSVHEHLSLTSCYFMNTSVPHPPHVISQSVVGVGVMRSRLSFVGGMHTICLILWSLMAVLLAWPCFFSFGLHQQRKGISRRMQVVIMMRSKHGKTLNSSKMKGMPVPCAPCGTAEQDVRTFFTKKDKHTILTSCGKWFSFVGFQKLSASPFGAHPINGL